MILRYFAFYILYILSLYYTKKKTHTVSTLTDDEDDDPKTNICATMAFDKDVLTTTMAFGADATNTKCDK